MSRKKSGVRRPKRAPGDSKHGSISNVSQPSLLRRWFGPGRSTRQRTFVGLALTVVAVAAGFRIVPLFEQAVLAGVFWTVAFVAIGVYIRGRRVLWVAFVGVVTPLVLVEVAQYLYLGAAEWEQRNIEHWSGTESALSKLSGQLIEYALFGIIFALVAGFGALVGRGLQGWWDGRDRPGTGGSTQSPTA